MAKKYNSKGQLVNLSNVSKYLGGMPTYKPKHKKIQIRTVKAPQKKAHYIPPTPKTSGLRWGP